MSWIYDAQESVRRRADWPAHMYAPLLAMTQNLDVVGQHVPRGALAGISPDRFTALLSSGTMLGAWRMTQGIYRIDESLYPALIDTPPAEIPVELLERIPEWCVYIETPGLHVDIGRRLALHGVWVQHDLGARGERLLGLMPDVDLADLVVQHIDLADRTVDECVRHAARDWAAKGGTFSGADVAAMVAWMQPVINLLLYLCIDESDIAGPGQPGNPAPVRTRRGGWRMFPAQGVRVWDVGVRIGAALRRAYQAEQAGTGGDREGPRPHVRRAHWHTIVSGARKRPDGTEIPAADRRRDLRWMPPIPVNVDDVGELPAVIRRV